MSYIEGSVVTASSKKIKFQPPDKERGNPDIAIKFAIRGHLNELKDYVSFFPDVVDARDPAHGNVILHVASSKGNIPLIMFLIQQGANINIPDMHGNTALHYAVDRSRKDAILCLLNNGAIVNQQDYKGNSPIHVACVNNDFEMVKLLLSKNADPELTDLNNHFPRDKTKLYPIQNIIDSRIEIIHTKGVANADTTTQTLNWMTFGVGLGVGMGMAIAKKQQFFIEQQEKLKKQQAESRKMLRSSQLESSGALVIRNKTAQQDEDRKKL